MKKGQLLSFKPGCTRLFRRNPPEQRMRHIDESLLVIEALDLSLQKVLAYDGIWYMVY